jgi:hypothetical protein
MTGTSVHTGGPSLAELGNHWGTDQQQHMESRELRRTFYFEGSVNH